MAHWTPDVIGGVTLALIFALIGWGGTIYCWIHKKNVKQGEVSSVDKWLSKKSTTAAGVAGGYAGFAQTNTEGTEMGRMNRRQGDLESGTQHRDGVVEGVDTSGQVALPPPVYDEERERMDARRSADVPGYQERVAASEDTLRNDVPVEQQRRE